MQKSRPLSAFLRSAGVTFTEPRTEGRGKSCIPVRTGGDASAAGMIVLHPRGLPVPGQAAIAGMFAATSNLWA